MRAVVGQPQPRLAPLVPQAQPMRGLQAVGVLPPITLVAQTVVPHKAARLPLVTAVPQRAVQAAVPVLLRQAEPAVLALLAALAVPGAPPVALRGLVVRPLVPRGSVVPLRGRLAQGAALTYALESHAPAINIVSITQALVPVLI